MNILNVLNYSPEFGGGIAQHLSALGRIAKEKGNKLYLGFPKERSWQKDLMLYSDVIIIPEIENPLWSGYRDVTGTAVFVRRRHTSRPPGRIQRTSAHADRATPTVWFPNAARDGSTLLLRLTKISRAKFQRFAAGRGVSVITPIPADRAVRFHSRVVRFAMRITTRRSMFNRISAGRTGSASRARKYFMCLSSDKTRVRRELQLIGSYRNFPTGDPDRRCSSPGRPCAARPGARLRGDV